MAQYDEDGNYVPGSGPIGGNSLPPGTPGYASGWVNPNTGKVTFPSVISPVTAIKVVPVVVPKAPVVPTATTGAIDDTVRVVGVSTNANEVLVKNASGQMYWKPGAEAQIQEARSVLASGEESYNKPYAPPAGITAAKPIPGALAAPVSGDSVQLYNYRGQVVTVTRDAVRYAANTTGEDQFHASIKIGLIPDDSKYIDEGQGQWGFSAPARETKVMAQTLSEVNASGKDAFDSFISQGKIPRGSLYAGVNTDGSFKYYPPDTVVSIGNSEVMSKEDYANLPREWKKVVDESGTAGLNDLAAKGDLPTLADEWWYRGEVISGEEKQRIIADWKDKRNTLSPSSDEYWRLGSNPEDSITRAVSVDDVARALGTFNQNVQAKVKNSVKAWDVTDYTLPNSVEGTVSKIGLWALNRAVRTGASAGLTLGEALTGISLMATIPAVFKEAVTNPLKTPDMAKGVVISTIGSFQTIGQAILAPVTVTPEATGTALANAYLTLVAVKGVAKMVATWVSPSGIPASLIGKESATGRVPIKDIDPVAMGKAMNEVEKAAMTPGGPASGDIPIEGTNQTLHYLKTPYQRTVGNTLWHGTGDMDFVGGTKLVARTVAEGGEPGWYTSPWAALDYAKGPKPGLVMILTDVNRVGSPGASDLARLPSNSDFFIRGAEEGLYGSSKTWLTDLETEIVAAPGTEFEIPPANADLTTRFTVGKSADFFTYRDGRFLPIKILTDKGLLPHIPTALDLYAVKLQALDNSLQNFTEAILHPGRTLGDIVGGKSLPGVRDVWMAERGEASLMFAQSLIDGATDIINGEGRDQDIAVGSALQSQFNRALDETYLSKAESLMKQYQPEITAYDRNPTNRKKFEEIYRVNLESAMRGLIETAATQREAAIAVRADIENRTAATARSSEISSSSPSASSRAVVRETDKSSVAPRETVTPSKSAPIRVIVDRPRPPDNVRPPDIVRPPDVVRPPDNKNPSDYIKPPVQKKDKPIEDKNIRPQDYSGAVAWKMGELNGKPEYIVLKYPYREPQDLISMDSVPDGAVLATGKSSAYRTARILKGIGPKNVNADVGMMDVNVTSKGRNVTLRFKPDPYGKTHYPLHLGKPRAPADNGLRSQKKGRIYHTKVGGGTLLSRRPLGRSRRG